MGLLKDVAQNLDLPEGGGEQDLVSTQQNGGSGSGSGDDRGVGMDTLTEDLPGVLQDLGQEGADFLSGDEDPPTTGPSGPGAMMQGSGFSQAIMMEMVEEAVSGRAESILEAIASGALQRLGPIGRPTQVETPRGTRNVSPPGYRTVYLNGEPFAVLKILATSLGLIDDSGPKTQRERMDDAAREYLKMRRRFEDLAPKVGLKTENRKSGPKR